MEAEIKTTLGDELHQACQDGDLDTVLGYISHQQTSSYKPPFNEMLYTAIFEDNLNVAKYCLENGAPVTDNILKKILVCRAKNVYIFVLESKRINVNHYIPWFGDMLSNAVTDNDLEWARLCLEHNADPNCNLVDEYMSVLATAAEVTCIEMVKLLVEHGASVKGSGAIVMAAQEGKLDVVQYLLDRGADIDEIGIDHPQDPRYREDMGSALHRAVNGRHYDVAKWLIQAGATVDLKDIMGRTPMDLARASQDEEMQGILEKAGAVA